MDSWLDTEENKTLLAICTRKTMTDRVRAWLRPSSGAASGPAAAGIPAGGNS